MAKYHATVGSHVTRFIRRNIIVYAKNEEEAAQKAEDKYIELEMQILTSVDAGSPCVDNIELV